MSATMTAAGLVLPMAEDSHFPPTPGDFWQPLFAIPGTDYFVTRPMVLMAIATGLLEVADGGVERLTSGLRTLRKQQ